ncbi:hypothetical protein JCM10212_005066 [Sporobolomyces blumeae]
MASPSALPPAPPNPSISTVTAPPLPSHPIDDALARDFPDVAHLSREDMLMLLDDSAYFDAYFNTMPQALTLHEAVEHQIKDNLELAQKSQEMKPELDKLRSETADLFDEANALKSRAQDLAEAQHHAYKRFAHDAQLARYRAAATVQEHLCESLVASFLDGQFENDEAFVKQYRDVRKVYHRRATALRKWEEGKVVWET